MLKLIAILVLSTNLNVAVETDNGWAEKTFQNSEEGAEQLVSFANQTVGYPPDGVRIVVGSINDKYYDEHIMNVLAKYGIKCALVAPRDVKAAALKDGIPESSPVAVAHADIARFGFIYRRK
jgi:hypothetical protein